MGAKALCFSREEIRQLLEKMGRSDLDDQAVDLLAKRSEGWVTGIILALQSNRTQTGLELLELSARHTGIFDYLAQEVLDQQPKEIQQFLLHSSLLTEMSAPLCDALLNRSDSSQMLRSLAEQGLFTFALDAEGNWYQYHNLFRQFLLARFRETDPEAFRQLRLRQAQLMADQANWLDAIDSYLDVHAYEQASEALEIIAREAFDGEHRDKLAHWIDALPDNVLDRHPRLMLFRARLYTEQSDYDRAFHLLTRAQRIYAEQDDHVGTGRALLQQAILLRLRGNYDTALSLIQQALDEAEDTDILTSIRAHQNMGICYSARGQYEQGIAHFQKALLLAEAVFDETNSAFIAHDLGRVQLYRGRLSEARAYFHRALLHWRRVGNPAHISLTLQGLGVVHRSMGQYAEAEMRFETSLERARDAQDLRLQSYAQLNLGDLYRDTGRFREALARYDDALILASKAQRADLVAYAMAARGDTFRRLRDWSRARMALTEALDQARSQQLQEQVGLAQLGLGALALALNHLEEATQRLETARELLEQYGERYDLGRALVLLALCALHQKDEARLVRHLRQAVALGREIGSFGYLVAEGLLSLPLLDAIDTLGLEGVDTVAIRAQIQELFSPTAKAPPIAVVRRDWPLEFLGLQGGQILRHGETLRDWEAGMARIMGFLLATYPNGLSRERIQNLLWPDADPSKVSSVFYSTVYRLRKALGGKEKVVSESGVYRFAADLNYRYDVTEFQGFAKLGQEQKGSGSHLARQSAIALYQTPFLEYCDLEWCDEIRRNLEETLKRLLLLEAQYLAQNDQATEAEALYLRLLSMDPLAEEAHRGIM
ncbi:tetratricopeptide repeat protein, partial [bacterium]|nr:tetratricopeptide repeat protein [bacterium]